MTTLSTLTKRDSAALFRVVEDSLSVDRPESLAVWLSGGIQDFIPHDMLLTAWGDFSLDLLHSAMVGRLPGTAIADARQYVLQPSLPELFERWERTRLPFAIGGADDPFHVAPPATETPQAAAIGRLRSAIVHGIKDERGHHDCLYILMSESGSFPPRAIGSLRLLLPYIDAVLRQAHLSPPPAGRGETDTGPADGANRAAASSLSQRELEIMRWVCIGKTNSEIGQILDISFFTVKNHLQRIFRKMDVLNRTQAVAKFERLSQGLAD